jgi:hypothetical protein
VHKFYLILLLGFASIFSQINMKVVANIFSATPNLFESKNILMTSLLVVRVGIPALITLLLTLYCYTKFGFYELVMAQSVYYIFALLAKYFYFHEKITTTDVVALLLIISAITLTLK